MKIAMILGSETKKYAWDDGSNVELPTKAVQKARKEEITHEGENIHGCEAGVSFREDKEVADQYDRS